MDKQPVVMSETKEQTPVCAWDFSIRKYNLDQKELTARVKTACENEILVNYNQAKTYNFCPHCGKSVGW